MAKFDEKKLFLTDTEFEALRTKGNSVIATTETVLKNGVLAGANHGANLKGILNENALMIADELMVMMVEGDEIPEGLRDLIENYLYLNNRIFRDAKSTFGNNIIEDTINKLFGEDAADMNEHLANLDRKSVV